MTTQPREKSVLVAIAAAPDRDFEVLAEMTGMSVQCVRESVRYLMDADLLFMTVNGGFLIKGAAMPL